MGIKTSVQRLSGWRTDGLVCGVAAALLTAVVSAAGFTERLDRWLYDTAVSRTSAEPATGIALVHIDGDSLQSAGPWPWPGEVHARLIDQLVDAGARTVVYAVALPEPAAGSTTPTPLAASPDATLSPETQLANSIQRPGNVLLLSSYSATGTVTPLPSFVRRSAIAQTDGYGTSGGTAQHPGAAIGAVAAGIGQFQLTPEDDGVLRRIPLLLNHDHVAVPSLAVMAVLRSLRLGSSELRPQKSPPMLRIAGRVIPTDNSAAIRPLFYEAQDGTQPAAPFTAFGAADVLAGKIPPNSLRDKTVIVGLTAAAHAERFNVPGRQGLFMPEILATTLSAITQHHTVKAPGWLPVAIWGTALATAIYLVVLLPMVSLGTGAGLSTLLVAALMGGPWLLLEQTMVWISMAAVALFLAWGQVCMVLLRLARRPSKKQSPETVEAERMMGLVLQGQGRLDEAFRRLQPLPPSNALLDNLYHLAQDFERQRQFDQARAVYKHLLRHDIQYRDARARYKRLRHLAQQDGAPASQVPAVSTPPRLAGDAAAGLPQLGRYEITKEIGKGAMGVVYLGRDPKIGRVVALKTLALGQEFEGAALVDARSRFFREAETAGRLQHPAIVTIFDAGEEHDLAYIAMEFIQGGDLVPACRPGHLMPVDTVLAIAAQVADALDYAHAHQVVHRDIKPANIMFDNKTQAVKVTDFGIARITDANKTRTGLVLGTPSFMSPEQLAGKRVDGRSDLYSLGVTLFQLLTGFLPLRGATMPELMQKIAMVEPPDIRTLRPELSLAIAQLIATALQKRPEHRPQTGRIFAAAIRSAAASYTLTPEPRGSSTVIYDPAQRGTEHDMTDFQQTVMEHPDDRRTAPHSDRR